MGIPHWLEGAEYSELKALCSHGEHIVYRGQLGRDGLTRPVLLVSPVWKQPSPHSAARLAHEFKLKDRLGSEWAILPLELIRTDGLDILVLSDPGGVPLSQIIGRPMEIGRFLRVAAASATAVARMHESGLVHKDIKPANIFLDTSGSPAWLTGFGIASLIRDNTLRRAPPELIAGSLAYMAPEQTGHVDRPIDLRSDLYSLGVTFYEALTGTLPFSDSDPQQLIHAHIARHPPSPAMMVPGVPASLSALVMKLLAKNVDERYQSAIGLLADLRHCQENWNQSGEIADFEPGKLDQRKHLLSRRRLYGRETELERVRSVWEAVKTNGSSEIVLIAGPAGAGKSSILNELRQTVANEGGFFAAGKFDQYKRDIPFAPLAEAFGGVIRQLLASSESELRQWANTLTNAVGSNGRLIANLIPELVDIIGDQPPVPNLSGPESKIRFLLAFRQFLAAFARPNRPLVLFLDDLQWLDTATLEVFEYLSNQAKVDNLLLVGAYRDNEVAPQHPLANCLSTIRSSAIRIQEIAIGGIGRTYVEQLITDALGAEAGAAERLSDIVFEKTGGNPFFTTQFLAQLVDEGLLGYSVADEAWRWDLDRIRVKKVSDSVVDLMMERLRRLPPAALRALQHLACLGNWVEASILSHALDLSEPDVRMLLAEPLRSGLIISTEGAYAVAHDRIQEAVYALLPEPGRSKMHAEIGSRLLKCFSEADLEAQIFDVVSQINRGVLDASSSGTRSQAAVLNLSAAKKARASAAYAAALAYLTQARQCLGDDAWNTQYELAFGIALEEAECMFLSGNFSKTAELIERSLISAANKIDKAAIYRLRVEFHVVMSQNDAAVETGLEALRLFGINFSSHPEADEVQREYGAIWTNLGDRPIECLVEQPAMTDPVALSIMRLLAEMWPPAFFTDINLTALVICRMVNVTLHHGIASASRQGIALLGWLMGPLFTNYEDGYRLVLLALELVSQAGSPVDIARTTDTVALTSSWSQPVAVAIDWWRKAHKLGVEAGDRYFACYSAAHAAYQLLMSGRPLTEFLGECEDYLSFARGIAFPDGIDLIQCTTRTIASLQGQTRGLLDFNDDDFDQEAFEAQLDQKKRIHVVVSWYWTRKTMLHFLSGNHEAALASSKKVPPGPYIKIVQLQQLDYHYYTALALAGLVTGEPRENLREELLQHQQQIGIWAAQAKSPTFADKYALVSAEIARLDGHILEAERLYEESIALARQNGFLQNQGIASELAARFYEQRGFAIISHAYLRAARDCFRRWGAFAKVRQLDERHPEVAQDSYISAGRYGGDATSTTLMPLEHLDVSTIIKISQAIAGEIIFEGLLDALMRLALEHAGARRAVLLLGQDGDPAALAEATDAAVVVKLSNDLATRPPLPESLIRYALRGKEIVVISDASVDNQFSFDPYIAQSRARSILCLPLMNRAKLIGLLYLENDLTPHIFTLERLTVLKLLASQAAISLENTRLYKELAEREGRIRRLVDANVIGIVIWDLDGRLIDANDAFLRMLQCDREDLAAGLRWFDMTPPEWQEVHARSELEELQATGTMQPREKEFFRKDGSRVPVLIGAAAFEQQPNQGVAYILDLTALKQAEAEARDSERRYREAQIELAHANRVANMGQLAGSIAHEVNQPIAGTVLNAETALGWLRRADPNLEEVEIALTKIVRDGTRAGEVVGRIRDMMKKAAPRKDLLEINRPIRQVIDLTHHEAVKSGVAITADLTDKLPLVRGDRVQLQQVVLNLIINAIEAMSSAQDGPREILIRTMETRSGDVLVAISDTGPGIDLNSVERIFETFYTTKTSGVGMGLSICRSIIEAHNGRIWATANKPRGSTFQFTLPPSDEAAATGS